MPSAPYRREPALSGGAASAPGRAAALSVRPPTVLSAAATLSLRQPEAGLAGRAIGHRRPAPGARPSKPADRKVSGVSAGPLVVRLADRLVGDRGHARGRARLHGGDEQDVTLHWRDIAVRLAIGALHGHIERWLLGKALRLTTAGGAGQRSRGPRAALQRAASPAYECRGSDRDRVKACQPVF